MGQHLQGKIVISNEKFPLNSNLLVVDEHEVLQEYTVHDKDL
jgi:hypothetical protein